MKAAIIVADMINDFVGGVFKNSRAAKIVPNIRQLLIFARKQEVPIIHVTDAHLPADREFSIWGPHAVLGTLGAEIIDELKLTKGDSHIFKRQYSAFQETELDQHLRELKVNTLILTGVLTDICILHTAADAFFRGYRIIVPRDCVETFDDETQNFAIKYLERTYGSKITTLAELMKNGLT